MKKLLSFCLMLFLCLLLPCQALYAKESLEAITVTEQNLKISLPESAYVLQAIVEEDNPYLALIGAQKEQVEEYYASNQIFLHAVAADQSYEIVCTVKDNTNEQYLTDLLLCSEEELKVLADSMATAYVDYGYLNIITDSYVAKNESFAVIKFMTKDDEDKSVQCCQYFSLLSDKAYYFTLRVFDENVYEDACDIMNDVVDSIRFIRKSTGYKYNYKNSTYGISFEIPEGWSEINYNSDHEYLQAQFAHENMLGETFQFYTYDIWSDFDTFQKMKTPRSALDTTKASVDLTNVKEYLEGFYSNFSKVDNKRYGSVYLLFEDNPVLLNHNDIQGKYYQQNYCMIKSGVLYVFQYGYYEGNDIHSADIDALLESIKMSTPKIFDKDAEAYKEISKLKMKITVTIVGVVLVFIALIVLAIFIIRKKINKIKENDII